MLVVMGAITTGLQADIEINPGDGGGVVIPNLESQPDFETPLCFSDGPSGATGELGKCLTPPIGPTGPVGPTGAIGPIGLMGPIGSTGPQGEKGDQGEQGLDGIPGVMVKLTEGPTWTGGGTGIVIAWCPSGKWVIGGGASTNTGAPMHVTSSAPSYNATSGWVSQGWEVRARTDTCFEGDWNITAIAYCVDSPPTELP